MTPREIREHFGRVKGYYLRNESVRALASTIKGMQGMEGMATPSELRGALREALQWLCKDQVVLKHLDNSCNYQPGQEKAILNALIKAYKTLRAEEDTEDRAATLSRKIRLDHAYNQGLKLLEQGKASEADASFSESVAQYKDEHRIFVLIGKALMEAGEVRRALPYLKRSVGVLPANQEAQTLLAECTRQRDALKDA